MNVLTKSLENLKELFVPEEMRDFMKKREKMNTEHMMKLEKQRKEKQKEN